MTGKDALLKAFDRLFDKAAHKLSVQCDEEQRTEAKQRSRGRFAVEFQ